MLLDVCDLINFTCCGLTALKKCEFLCRYLTAGHAA